MKAEDLVNNNSLSNIVITGGDTVVYTGIALTAINMARMEERENVLKWISVKEQLPLVDENSLSEQSDPVLVIIGQKGFYEPEILVYNKHYHVWDTADGDDFRCRVSDGDFWMAIPELKE